MNGGHPFDGFSSMLGLLLHLDEFSDVVSVDVDAGTIEVQAGMHLGRLYGVVIELNRLRRFGDGSSTHALPVGTFATVGVVGQCVLCGGHGASSDGHRPTSFVSSSSMRAATCARACAHTTRA
jgi:hypothetical protein